MLWIVTAIRTGRSCQRSTREQSKGITKVLELRDGVGNLVLRTTGEVLGSGEKDSPSDEAELLPTAEEKKHAV